MVTQVQSERELQNVTDDLQEEGWKLKTKTGGRAVLKKNDYGSLGAHALIFLLTSWWSMGFGNLAYAAKRFWMNSRKRIVRVTED